jgi:hypothetical protein
MGVGDGGVDCGSTMTITGQSQGRGLTAGGVVGLRHSFAARSIRMGLRATQSIIRAE